MSYSYTTHPANITINASNTSATSYNWANVTSNITWSGSALVENQSISPASLQVSGDANFNGDLRVQGKSLLETLEKIEEKLAILHANEELESRWEKLRDLRKQYMAMEAEIKEKELMWDILKK